MIEHGGGLAFPLNPSDIRLTAVAVLIFSGALSSVFSSFAHEAHCGSRGDVTHRQTLEMSS